jgi:hypothetical protein
MSSDLLDVPSLDDRSFLQAFHGGQIANQQFHHREHLRLAWLQVRALGVDRAGQAVAAGIREFASRHGHARKYNDTITRFWVQVMGLATQRHPDLGFDALLALEPHLLDKWLPLRHWSREALYSVEARHHWVAPDLQPMP